MYQRFRNERGDVLTLIVLAIVTLIACLIVRPKPYVTSASQFGYPLIVGARVESGESAAMLIVSNDRTDSRGVGVCFYKDGRPVASFAIGLNVCPFYVW
jgi:hypothetical protein